MYLYLDSSFLCNVMAPFHLKYRFASTNQGFAGPGFVNWNRDQEISPFGPATEIGTGNYISISEFGYCLGVYS